MQIKGDEFIKKVQIQQEREELERKLNELEEVEMSINNDSVIFEKNSNVEENEHELDNIMLGSSITNEDNKKKYLILGIVLVVLFLLTIIIIRLLTNEAPKEDQFTSNSASSTEMKKLSESDNIEQNFQKIINERVKKDANEPMVPEVQGNTSTTPSGNAEDSGTSQAFENLQKEAENYNSNTGRITDEAIDQTIKKVEKSKSVPREKTVVKQKEESLPKEDTVVKKVETKRTSIKDLVDTPSSSTNDTSSSSVSSGYFIQIGAFTKKPSDSYVNSIRNAKLKYKIYQDEVKGTTYNKVLIGPYNSKAAASENIEDVKQKLNVTSAFVVKF
ncbi:MAG: SPOR domain-containing protein [Aliarcobacter sp.]|nr:SPOR domain-containing protein [Aliarcobacter sp.]